MKKNLLTTLFIGLVILFCNNAFTQTWDDVIKEVKGDTAVVYGFTGAGNVLNTLWIAVKGDTTAGGERTNLNRVYETIPGEVYLTDGTLELDASVPMLKIVAPPIDRTGDQMPPLHIKQTQIDGSFDKTFFQVNGDIYMSNQYILLALTDNTLDREVMRTLIDGTHTEFDNCIFEFTNWVLCFPSALHQTFKFTNCLFINVGHEPTLEKGLPFDSWISVDTIWMENCTVLNAGGVTLGRTPNHVSPDFAYFNHNTFVNTTLPPFNFAAQAEMIATNNIIVNTSLVPTYPGFYPFWEDEDQQPNGIINIDTVEAAWIADNWPDGYPVAEGDRKLMADMNNTFWDSRFQDMFDSQLPEFPDTIDESWISQMINMNDRTQLMFNDDANYPYLVDGTWYNIEPDFANNQDLVTDWVAFIVSNSTPGAPGGGNNQPWWRTNMAENLVTPDWPPLADLSYTDATLMSGGTYGFPLGDLNWFPSEKAQWEMTGESAKLIDALKAGRLVSTDPIRLPRSNSVLQVSAYPNPFSERTSVKFDITSGSNAELILYDVLGKRVRTLDLGYRTTGSHEVLLDKGELNPGIYILRIKTDYDSAGLTTKISIK